MSLADGRPYPAHRGYTVHSAEARKASLDEVRARLNAAIARALEGREAEDLCRFEDLRIAANRKEAAENSSI